MATRKHKATAEQNQRAYRRKVRKRMEMYGNGEPRPCKECKRVLPPEKFVGHVNTPRWNWCKDCRQVDAERRRGLAKQQGLKITCNTCGKPFPATLEFFHKGPNSQHGLIGHCKTCWRVHIKEINRKSARRARQKILLHYSGGERIECCCCGESRYEFMTLDHIHGGGSAERKAASSTSGYWFKLARELPENKFRVLCMNCNHARGHYGYCPHEREREAQAKSP